MNGSRTSDGSETYGGFAGHDRGENREDRVESKVTGMLRLLMRICVLAKTIDLVFFSLDG